MRRFFIISACLASAAGCGGGGGGGSPAPPFIATPAPTASPTPPPAGPLSASKSAVAFTAQGQSATVDVGETGYAGAIAFDGAACAGVASIGPASPQSAPVTFTITALGAGSCTLEFADRFGQRASVTVGVTVTRGSIQ